MTKEKLKNRVLNGCRGSGKTFRLLCEVYENKIADLEKEKAQLEQNKKTVAHLAYFLEEKMKQQINDLEKKNAKLKEQVDKWFVFETDAGNWGMDKATQYTVDRHNYFYGTKEECQKWGVEHKIKDYTGHKYCYDRLEDQLIKAKELIKELLSCCRNYPQENAEKMEKAEQFLKADVGTKNYEEQDKILKTRLL